MAIFIIDDFNLGGVTTYVQIYTKLLSKNNIKPIVIGLDETNKAALLFPHCQIHTINFSPTRKKSIINYISIALEYKSIVKQIVKENKNSKIYFHFNVVKSTIMLFLFSPIVWRNTKIYTFHGSLHSEFTTNEVNHFELKKWIKTKLYYFLQHFILRNVKKIIVLSNFSKKIILQTHASNLDSKIMFIPGFLDQDEVRSKTTKTTKTTNKLIISTIGRAEPRKGMDTLIKSLVILKNESISFYAYIAGPMNYLLWYPQLLSLYENSNLFESLHFLHSANELQKEHMLKKTNLFIVPSKSFESFGYVTIEAMSKGIPVIGSNSGATPEILNKIDRRLLFKVSGP